MTKNILIIIILALSYTRPVYAYIDPVTGSVIIQSVIGAFAVALVALRGLRERIVSFFKKSPETKETRQEAGETEKENSEKQQETPTL